MNDVTLAARAATLRAALAPAADPNLAITLPGVRAALSPAYRAALEEEARYENRNGRRSLERTGVRRTFQCGGCRKLIGSPNAKCRSCGYENGGRGYVG